MPAWDRFVCVDWGKDLRKRKAWVAEIATRRVAPLDAVPALPRLLESARAAPGRTLIAIDAALGVPRHYVETAGRMVPQWRDARDFLQWIALATADPEFLRACGAATEWKHDRPFIAVPKGRGALRAFWKSAGRKLLRDVDAATGAKSPFIVSGIPGTVGSGTRALWCELAPLLSDARDFAVWPFDGRLDAIDRRVAVAEIYPRVCYSLALCAELPAGLMRLAKTKRPARDGFVRRLETMSWVREHQVTVAALDLARADEDHFDAMISAAGLLRCVLEGHALEGDDPDDVEGGILGLASLHAAGPAAPSPLTWMPPSGAPAAPGGSGAGRRSITCPIEGCSKTYAGSRGGWDAHVGSPRTHPSWHPHVRDPERRKALFRREHAKWFD